MYITWYQEDFNAAPLGTIVGYDTWRDYSFTGYAANPVAESFVISTKYGGGGRALSCETQPLTTTHLTGVTRQLQPRTQGYEFNISIGVFTALSTNTNAQLQIRMGYGNDANFTWALRLDYRGQITMVGYNRPTSAYQIYTLPGTHCVDALTPIKITVDPQGTLLLYIISESADPLFTSQAKITEADRVILISSSSPKQSLGKFAVDDFLIRYYTPLELSPAQPKPPTNVTANAKQNYSVISWDRVTSGVVDGTITRGTVGDLEDYMGASGLATSPVIIKAIINGTTLTNNLPVEGRDFRVNRNTGIITWSASSAAIRPDYDTDYEVRFELPTSSLTSYKVYKANLLNEADLYVYREITGLDFDGYLETATVDTSVGDTQIYRVATVNSDMVESELSNKAMVVKSPSQIDSKQEVLDRKLFDLDKSNLDEGILR